MSDWDQLPLFETGAAHARGPLQSQQTLDSLGHDQGMKFRIALATVMLSEVQTWPVEGSGYVTVHTEPVTDDAITEWMEHRFGRRYQRNVIARTRGLMEQAGWFVQVPDVIGRTGRKTRAMVPDPATVAAITTWLRERHLRAS